MARMLDGAARMRLALVILVSGALALLMPSLSTATVESPSAVMLTAVAALVAAAVGLGRRLTSVVSRPLAGQVRGAAETAPFLASRVTDTAHHPVRPRAPGVV